MARTLELDTITEPSNNTGNANITLSSDATTTMPKVDVNGGAIDGTTVGAAVPSSVAATTLSASGNATVGGTFGATGATTLSSTATVGGTLGVTGNTTLSGSANNIGTVTAGTMSGGTITNGVTQDGVVRLVKCVVVTGAEYQVGSTTNLYVPHDSITVPVTSGKTYIVETEFNIMMEDESDPQDDGNMTAYLRLHNHSAAVEQGDNSSSNTAYGSTLWAQQGQFYSPSSVMDPPAAKGWIMKWN